MYCRRHNATLVIGFYFLMTAPFPFKPSFPMMGELTHCMSTPCAGASSAPVLFVSHPRQHQLCVVYDQPTKEAGGLLLSLPQPGPDMALTHMCCSTCVNAGLCPRGMLQQMYWQPRPAQHSAKPANSNSKIAKHAGAGAPQARQQSHTMQSAVVDSAAAGCQALLSQASAAAWHSS